MSKIDFSKVEHLLEVSLAQVEIKNLGKLADIAQKIGRPEMRQMIEKSAKAASKNQTDKLSLLHVLRQTLKKHKNPSFYESLAIPLEKLKNLLEKSSDLKVEEWALLQELRLKVNALKAEDLGTHPEKADDSIVEQERKKHINKRFNVRDKWLPLK